MQDDLTNQFNKNGFLILQSIFNAEETEQIVSFIHTEQAVTYHVQKAGC